MKKALSLIIVVLTLTTTFAQQKEKIKQNAQLMADAYVKENFSVLLTYTYPKVLAMAGGKAAMLKAVNSGYAQMKAQGVSIKGASVEAPDEIVHIGKRLFALVPQAITMAVKGGTLSAQSGMLAISEDSGAHWYFINSGTMKDSAIYQFFPELKGKMDMPKQREPVFTPDN